ncbi:MAG: hypothetical protein QM736_27290 [Vicinamibacterales bacterium]
MAAASLNQRGRLDVLQEGYIVVGKEKVAEDVLMNAVLEAGGDDMRGRRGELGSVSASEEFPAVLEAVKALGIEPAAAEIDDSAELPEARRQAAQQMVKLMDVARRSR